MSNKNINNNNNNNNFIDKSLNYNKSAMNVNS